METGILEFEKEKKREWRKREVWLLGDSLQVSFYLSFIYYITQQNIILKMQANTLFHVWLHIYSE